MGIGSEELVRIIVSLIVASGVEDEVREVLGRRLEKRRERGESVNLSNVGGVARVSRVVRWTE